MLRLVKPNNAPRDIILALIAHLTPHLDDVVSERTYSPSKLPLWDVEMDGMPCFRIILDEASEHAGRQGIHAKVYETDAQHFESMLDDLERDGFDTIWFHV